MSRYQNNPHANGAKVLLRNCFSNANPAFPTFGDAYREIDDVVDLIIDAAVLAAKQEREAEFRRVQQSVQYQLTGKGREALA